MREDLLPKTFSGGLTRLIQECAEVIKATTKLQQYGPTAVDFLTGIEYDNTNKLISELTDLNHAIASVQRELSKRGFSIPELSVPVTEFEPDHPDLFRQDLLSI